MEKKALTYQNIPEDDLQFDGKARLYAIISLVYEHKCVDFGDLILHVIEMKQTIALKLSQFIKYILVMVPDTNMAQYLLLRLLPGNKKFAGG